MARRSIAAGLAVECLVVEGANRKFERGLLIAAIMNSLGRVVLGTLFPQCYTTLLATCHAQGQALAQHEAAVFGESQTAVMSRLLKCWGVSSEVYLPLKHVDDGYQPVAALPEPIRTRTELIKLAMLIGQLAVGEWESWDLLEFPSPTVLKRLGIESVPDIVARVRLALKDAPLSPGACPVRSSPQAVSPRQLTYYNLAGGTTDFLALMLETQGYKLVTSSKNMADAEPPVLVNCLEVPVQRLAARVKPRSGTTSVIVCSPEVAGNYSEFGETATIPGAFGRLRLLLL